MALQALESEPKSFSQRKPQRLSQNAVVFVVAWRGRQTPQNAKKSWVSNPKYAKGFRNQGDSMFNIVFLMYRLVFLMSSVVKPFHCMFAVPSVSDALA